MSNTLTHATTRDTFACRILDPTVLYDLLRPPRYLVMVRESGRTLLVAEALALDPPYRLKFGGMDLFHYQRNWVPGSVIGRYPNFGLASGSYTIDPISTHTAPSPLVVEDAVWADWNDDSRFPTLALEVTVLIVDTRPASAGRVAVLCSFDGVDPVDPTGLDDLHRWEISETLREGGAYQTGNVSDLRFPSYISIYHTPNLRKIVRS